MRISKKLTLVSAVVTALAGVLTTDASDPLKMTAEICMATVAVAYIVTEGFAVDRVKQNQAIEQMRAVTEQLKR